MLLFISCGRLSGYDGNLFQNISCYCLSAPLIIVSPGTTKFQNISCYCLSQRSDPRLLVQLLFQNISCYCLSVFVYLVCWWNDISKHLMLLFIGNIPSYAYQNFWFQNISCYCLSGKCGRYGSPYYVFQNISCYCLSWKTSVMNWNICISKHLMLLFIIIKLS